MAIILYSKSYFDMFKGRFFQTRSTEHRRKLIGLLANVARNLPRVVDGIFEACESLVCRMGGEAQSSTAMCAKCGQTTSDDDCY